jgi:hypothetical protein
MLLSIPPHASHMLQPFDEALLGPLETAYVRQADTFMADSPWKSLSYKLLVCFGQCIQNSHKHSLLWSVYPEQPQAQFVLVSVSKTATSTVSAQPQFTHSAHTFFSEGCSCSFLTLQHFLCHTILILLALVFILIGIQRCQFVNIFSFYSYVEIIWQSCHVEFVKPAVVPQKRCRAMPWLKWLVTDLSPQRLGFDPRPVHVVSVVDKVTLGRNLCQVHQFSSVTVTLPMFHTCSFICHGCCVTNSIEHSSSW